MFIITLNMPMELIKLSGEALENYFAELKARQVEIRKPNHDWHTPKRLKWLTYCDDCGLVWSSNKATQKAIHKGCIQRRLREKS